MQATRSRLAVLGSTRGTHLLNLLEAQTHGQLNADIVVVLCNKSDALILERAKQHNIPAFFVASQGLTREQYDEKLSQILQEYHIDLIVLVGYMRILSKPFVQRWQGRIINIHPSLLPRHAGLMDLAVHQAVLQAGETESGCTVHYVEEAVDQGPILLQKKCPVFSDDTPETLKQRVQGLEAAALIEAIQRFQNL